MNGRDVSIEAGVIDALIDWPVLLADNELGSPDDFWRGLDETDRVVMLRDHFSRRLVEFGIDAASYRYSLADAEALHVFTFELYCLFDRVTKLIELDRLEWDDELRDGLWRLSQIVALRLEKRNEKSRRAKIARKGSRGRGDRKKEIREEAIRRYDPGPDSGTKAYRSRIIRKRAQDAGYENADKLPKRLDRYLP